MRKSLICKDFRNPKPNLKKDRFFNPLICKSLICKSRLYAKEKNGDFAIKAAHMQNCFGKISYFTKCFQTFRQIELSPLRKICITLRLPLIVPYCRGSSFLEYTTACSKKFRVHNVRSGCPISQAQGSCLNIPH